MNAARTRSRPCRAGAALGLLLALLLYGCSRPYATAVSGDRPGAEIVAFTGLQDILARHGVASVLWVHGMGVHGDRWAKSRAELVATALDGAASFSGRQQIGGGRVVSFTVTAGARRLELNFLNRSGFAGGSRP